MSKNVRYIGIRHRVKRSVEGEARPTQVVILDGNKTIELALASETDELDFVLGRYPTSMRPITEADDLSTFPAHQVEWKKLKDDENADDFSPAHIRKAGKNSSEVARKVPKSYEGLRAGDKVAMMLGGSGDNLAFSMARRGDDVGVSVYRIPPFVFQNQITLLSDKRDKDQDAQFLAQLLRRHSNLFYQVDKRDRAVIMVRENLRARVDAMKARIACEQRLRQRVIGQTFCSPDGLFPEGTIEKQFDELKATDKVYLSLAEEEKSRNSDLLKACEDLDLYRQVFANITGCGPAIAARIIGAVVDIRRFVKPPDQQKLNQLKAESEQLENSVDFETDLHLIQDRIKPETSRFQIVQMMRSQKRKMGKESEALLLDQALELHQRRHRVRRDALLKSAMALRAFCGVHLQQVYSFACGKTYRLEDLADPGVVLCPHCGTQDHTMIDRFPRRRNGGVANWNGDARQALYLLGDQWNKRPDSEWGKIFRQVKVEYRKKHPEVVVEGGKKRYTDGHIHKMAVWYTLGKFVEWLFREWYRFERQHAVVKPESADSKAAAA